MHIQYTQPCTWGVFPFISLILCFLRSMINLILCTLFIFCLLILCAEALNRCNQRRQPQWSDRQKDSRRLVIRVGTDTNKNTHTLVKMCRCICTVYIYTNIRTQMRAHKRWKHTIIKEQDIGSSCEKWSRDDINNRMAFTTQDAAAS